MFTYSKHYQKVFILSPPEKRAFEKCADYAATRFMLCSTAYGPDKIDYRTHWTSDDMCGADWCNGFSTIGQNISVANTTAPVPVKPENNTVTEQVKTNKTQDAEPIAGKKFFTYVFQALIFRSK